MNQSFSHTQMVLDVIDFHASHLYKEANSPSIGRQILEEMTLNLLMLNETCLQVLSPFLPFYPKLSDTQNGNVQMDEWNALKRYDNLIRWGYL